LPATHEFAGLTLKERAVLRKFPADIEVTEDSIPDEVVVAEDGVIVDHWFKGDDREPPE
jgi:transcription termination factor NusB